MDTVICKHITVNQHGAVVVVDARLHPGEVVEVVVRSLNKPAPQSFHDVARTVRIDAPADYSTSFEDALRTKA